jgi:hypothetical protein
MCICVIICVCAICYTSMYVTELKLHVHVILFGHFTVHMRIEVAVIVLTWKDVVVRNMLDHVATRTNIVVERRGSNRFACNSGLRACKKRDTVRAYVKNRVGGRGPTGNAV